jgi:hypothetical protein
MTDRGEVDHLMAQPFRHAAAFHDVADCSRRDPSMIVVESVLAGGCGLLLLTG